ncbi:hypothetical protein CDAR_55501 [Caerostris darwini]|uniref:Uncharacterized protein n=1 Tax=Caerostris darwini TaxID=1538125 RepID=A0AAV4U5I1_9ARAC|nr:hypothetical protein CDAR_55501 [Caerostris darwini]
MRTPEAPFRSFQTHSVNAPLMGLKREFERRNIPPESFFYEIIVSSTKARGTSFPPIQYSIAFHPCPKVHPPFLLYSSLIHPKRSGAFESPDD